MQRWLLIGGAIVLLLFGAGLPTAYHFYKQSRPHPVWLPIPTSLNASIEDVDNLMSLLKTQVPNRENLSRIGRELDLKDKWGMDSDEEVVDEIVSRFYVKRGDMDSPMGKLPAIHVGLRGTNRDREISTAIVNKLIPEVWKILGVDPTKRR
ncbi:MAG: hypothetical protein RLZ22_328 [Verrucomicrobiota bacterium]|jgi:hypothetical protein